MHPAYPPQMQMPPPQQGMPGRPMQMPMMGRPAARSAGGMPKAVPVVVSAGLAIGVFCGLYFGLGRGTGEDAAAGTATAGSSAPPSAAGATDEVTNFKSAAPDPSTVAAAPDAAPVAPPPPPVPADFSVVLTFAITPPDASITIDGEPVTGGTATITFTGEAKTVRIVAKASGHKSYDKRVTVTKDATAQDIPISLDKRAAGPPRPPRPPRDRDPPGGLIDL